jgi:predicted permease
MRSMSWLDAARHRWRLLFDRQRLREEMEEELQFHLALDAMQASPDEDVRESRRRFGHLPIIREDRRRASGLALLDRIGQDATYAIRQLRRAPGFTIAVALTLSLGVGANATMFAVIDRLMLRAPEGITGPDRVVEFRSVQVRRDGRVDSAVAFAYPSYMEFRAMSDVFASVSAVRGPIDLSVDRGVTASIARGSLVADDYFQVLGVRPARGRFFSTDETREPGGDAVVVISNDHWRRRFAGATDIVGRTLLLQGHPYTVIGVAPRGFSGHTLDATDVWLPLATATTLERGGTQWVSERGSRFYRVIARLQPGTTRERATARISVGWTAWNIRPDRPATSAPPRVHFTSLIPAEYAARPEHRVAKLLAVVAGLLLVITCANVANLLLARALARRREIGVRLALGVSRSRLASLFVMDAVLLALLGSVGALVVAWWATPVVRTMLMAGTVVAPWSMDARLVAFTVAIAVVSGAVAGIVPAMQASAPSLLGALRQGARDGTVHRSRTRMVLLVAQGALCIALLAGTGLFVRSLQRIDAQHLGLDLDRVLVADYHARRGSESPERVREVYRQMTTRALAVPGVESASLSVGVPFEGQYALPLAIPGHDSIPGMQRGHAPFLYAVTPTFFRTLGTRIVAGRGLTDLDDVGAHVAVVNATMARLIWPKGDAIGQCFKIVLRSPTADCVRVIGIVEDVRRDALIEPEPWAQYYVPLGQAPRPLSELTLLIRATNPDRVRPLLHRALQGTHDDLPYVKVRSLREAVSRELRPWRLGFSMFALFGGLALVVAAVGTYSVMQFSVTQRVPEIGIRMALGARRGNVIRLFAREAVRISALAGLGGVAVVLLAGPLVSELLFETSPRDPLVIGAVVLILMASAIAATLLPAWRATRVDPVTALRAD